MLSGLLLALLAGTSAARELKQIDRTISVHDPNGNGLTNQESLGLGSFSENNAIKDQGVGVNTNFALDDALPNVALTENDALSADNSGTFNFNSNSGSGLLGLLFPDDDDLIPLDSGDATASSAASSTNDDDSADASSDASGASADTDAEAVLDDSTPPSSSPNSPVTILVPVSPNSGLKDIKSLLATPSPPPPSAQSVPSSLAAPKPVVLVPAASPDLAPAPAIVIVSVPSGSTPEQIASAVGGAAAGR